MIEGENLAEADAIQGSKGAPLEDEDEELEDDELDEDAEFDDAELELDDELEEAEELDELDDELFSAPPPHATNPILNRIVSQVLWVICLITAMQPLGFYPGNLAGLLALCL